MTEVGEDVILVTAGLSAQMSCRVSRIQQTLAVLGRRLRRLCLVSN